MQNTSDESITTTTTYIAEKVKKKNKSVRNEMLGKVNGRDKDI